MRLDDLVHVHFRRSRVSPVAIQTGRLGGHADPVGLLCYEGKAVHVLAPTLNSRLELLFSFPYTR